MQPRYKAMARVRGKWRMIEIFDRRSDAQRAVDELRRDGFAAFVASTQPVKRNPRAKRNDFITDQKRAQRLYKSFTGKTPPAARKIQVPSFTKSGVVFGTLFGVGYISERDGKPYQHTFRAKSRPLLIASSDGKSVLIVGGRFAFTERGIVDK